MGALARTDISASDGQDGMRKEGDSPDFEYRRQMAGTPQAWSHLAFMIRDDRVSGHVRLMSRDVPVISFGCSIPISSIRVGAMSAKQPPSLSL